MAVTEAPQEIKTLFGKYSENGVMTAVHLQRFLVQEQKEENATIEDAQAIIDSIRHVVFHKSGISLEGFFKYLFGDLNPPLNPKLGVIFFSFYLFLLNGCVFFLAFRSFW